MVKHIRKGNPRQPASTEELIAHATRRVARNPAMRAYAAELLAQHLMNNRLHLYWVCMYPVEHLLEWAIEIRRANQ